jgi:hypothetical protein
MKGNWFGEEDLFNFESENQVRLFAVKAIEDCELIALTEAVAFFFFVKL